MIDRVRTIDALVNRRSAAIFRPHVPDMIRRGRGYGNPVKERLFSIRSGQSGGDSEQDG